MVLNIRYTDPDGADAIVTRMRDASGLAIEVRGQCPPVFFSADTPVFRKLRTCMERSLGQAIAMTRMNGATDARHFAHLGVPIAIIGIPGIDPHGAGEAIDLAGTAAYRTMLTEFLRGFPV